MTDYTPEKAERLILSGKATGPINVTGSLYLSGTQITALPDNLTVGGSLYLSGTQITALPDNLTVGGSLDLRGLTSLSVPTPWWREKGETTRRRCISIDPSDGYALAQTDTDRFFAGCRKNLTRAHALKHWGRTDARAVLFTAAIKAHELAPVA